MEVTQSRPVPCRGKTSSMRLPGGGIPVAGILGKPCSETFPPPCRATLLGSQHPIPGPPLPSAPPPGNGHRLQMSPVTTTLNTAHSLKPSPIFRISTAGHSLLKVRKTLPHQLPLTKFSRSFVPKGKPKDQRFHSVIRLWPPDCPLWPRMSLLCSFCAH